MNVLLIAVGVVSIGGLLALTAYFSRSFGRNTCRECGGFLPVLRFSKDLEDSFLNDWACPKCGTRFDRQARARNQLPT